MDRSDLKALVLVLAYCKTLHQHHIAVLCHKATSLLCFKAIHIRPGGVKQIRMFHSTVFTLLFSVSRFWAVSACFFLFKHVYLCQLLGTLSQLWELLSWAFVLWCFHPLSPSQADREVWIDVRKHSSKKRHYNTRKALHNFNSDFRHRQLWVNGGSPLHKTDIM